MTTVVREEGIPAAKRAIRSQIAATWAKHPSAARFIQDYFADRWADIQQCSTTFKVWRDRTNPTRYKIIPIGCRSYPFCIGCNARRLAQRTHDALNAFSRCTPRGKQPVLQHIVVSAPITEQGAGWGMAASRDHRRFARITFQTLTAMHGDGIGTLESYQDWGERCFAKRHPHIDLTLNLWRLQDGQAMRMQPFGLKGAGKHRWAQDFAARATVFDIDATRWGVNFKLLPPITGFWPYYQTLRYQLRELFDPRKIEYSREKATVWWKSYATPQREKITVGDFLFGWTEYQHRLGPWTKDDGDGRQNLHFRYGHLSNRSIDATETAMGGAPIPHGKRCPCSECGDWDRIFPD